MMGGFNPGAPLGSVICTQIIDSDSVVINIAVGVADAIAGAMAWDNTVDAWTEREKKRREAAKYQLSEI